MNALKPILYYSIFNYPLTKVEIYRYSDAENIEIINTELKTLIERKALKEYKGFFIYNNDNTIAERRITGNLDAKKVMPKALKRAKFISKFPYIESVSISGSLSKGNYENDGDVDFFLITKPNRLWIARTCLIVYKKVILQNSKKYFCVNYFISSDHLEISEKNLFTATELATLIPVTGKKIFTEFIDHNNWAKSHFPNIDTTRNHKTTDVNPFLISKCIEILFNWKLGEIIDNLFRGLTLKRWTSKFSELDKKQFKIALKSTKSVSKHHPQNFQKKVIDAYNNKVLEFEKTYNLKIK